MDQHLPLRVSGFLRLIPVLILDAGLVLAAYAGALALRFDGDIPSESIRFLGEVAAGLALAYIAGNYFFRIYRTDWKYAGMMDAINLALAVGLVSGIVFGVNSFLSPRHIPLSVNLMAAPLIFLGMGASKLWPRFWARNPFTAWGPTVQQVLIVGAGHTGQLLAREFLQHPQWQYRPVGYIDDDPRKKSMRIHGVAVLGNRHDIPAISHRRRIDLVALALPSISGATMRELVGVIQSAGLKIRTVPGLRDIVRGEARPAQLREVTADDLMGRDQVEIDADACAEAVRGRSVLITGAAGYIGAELAAQLLGFGPAVLHLLDINETGLYDLQRDLTSLRSDGDVRIWITDIADAPSLARVFAATRPDIVFHAAAYKHIPVMEEQPEAALRANVIGMRNVCLAAHECGTGKFVMVSSDKAVNPDNVYGATKRIGELLVSAMAEVSHTVFCAVRFGNVMGARGSVVPLWLRQIERGGPVLLTHPDVTRFFMSVSEAVSLVIQTASFAGQGEVFLLDMGEEVKIADLAEKLIRLKGYEPGHDIKVVYTGLRAGEKLREELVGFHERLSQTHHAKVFLMQGRPVVTVEEILDRIDDLEQNLPDSREELATRLHALARIDLRDTGAPAGPPSSTADPLA